MSFADLNISTELLRAVEERNHTSPTPVQLAAIPAVLQRRDLQACAQTGSGKTAAFALPILERISHDTLPQPRITRALILVPTRELAAQVGETFISYARYLTMSIKIISVFGGVSINPQMMALRGGAEIIVATPGRLLDLVRNNALRLSHVETLVLDEADRLFDLGFAEEFQQILQLLPPRRQNLLFSATFPATVNALAQTLLQNPVMIDVPATDSTTPDIEQRAIEVDDNRRTQLLRYLIETHGWTRVLVFVATQYATEHVSKKLRVLGINAAPFHGELSQGARTRTLTDFKASRVKVVVATDVAARGIDISQLPVVVNFDLPRSTVDYVHRIGRTGRAGEHGVAVSFVSAASEAHFRLIEKRNDLVIPREQIAGFERIEVAAAAAPIDVHGGVKGKRKSKKDKLRDAAARSKNAAETTDVSDDEISPSPPPTSPWGRPRGRS